MTDPKNIGPEEKSEDANELMKKYIDNKLNLVDQWETEHKTANSPLLSDAEEGLRLINDKAQLPHLTESINRSMRTKLKKRNGEKKKGQPQIFLLVIVVLLLLLILTLSFMVLFKLKMT